MLQHVPAHLIMSSMVKYSKSKHIRQSQKEIKSFFWGCGVNEQGMAGLQNQKLLVATPWLIFFETHIGLTTQWRTDLSLHSCFCLPFITTPFTYMDIYFLMRIHDIFQPNVVGFPSHHSCLRGTSSTASMGNWQKGDQCTEISLTTPRNTPITLLFFSQNGASQFSPESQKI